MPTDRSPPPDGPRPRAGRPRDPQLDGAILDAALELFAAGGLAAVTFEGIAERTGTSRSSIYRRFSTRDEVILAGLDRLRRARESGAEDWASRPVLKVLEQFCRLTIASAGDPLSLGLLRQVVALEPAHPIKQAYLAAVITPRRRIFAEMILSARASGELPPGPAPEVLQDLLAGAITYRLLMHPRELQPDEVEPYLAEVFDALGLRPRRGDP